MTDEMPGPRCAGCYRPFERTAAATGFVGVCACGGAWVDAAACLALLRGALDRESKALLLSATRAAPGEPAEPATGRAPEGGRRCPDCGAALAPCRIEHPALVVGACREHGAFFAREDLAAIDASADVRRARDERAADGARLEVLQRALVATRTARG